MPIAAEGLNAPLKWSGCNSVAAYFEQRLHCVCCSCCLKARSGPLPTYGGALPAPPSSSHGTKLRGCVGSSQTLQVEEPPPTPMHLLPLCSDRFRLWHCWCVCCVDQIHLGAVAIPGGVGFAKLWCCRGMFPHYNIDSPHCSCGLVVANLIWWCVSSRQSCSINKLCSSLVSEKKKPGCEKGSKTYTALWNQKTKNELGNTSLFSSGLQ